MGGYTSSDDETLGSAGPNVGGQASTPPEFRFLATGRRSLKEYLLGTASSNNTNTNSLGPGEAAIRPPSPPALVGGGDGSSASVVAASAFSVSSSFERIEHPHASSSAHSFLPDSFASLGSLLFQQSLSSQQEEKEEETETLLGGGSFHQVRREDAVPVEKEEEEEEEPVLVEAPASPSWTAKALETVLGWTLRPRSLALLLLATTSATWRLKLSVAERRAAVWEGRCAVEGGKRAAAEAELARALQRLAEVEGALEGCQAEQEALRWRAPEAVVVVGSPSPGEGVESQGANRSRNNNLGAGLAYCAKPLQQQHRPHKQQQKGMEVPGVGRRSSKNNNHDDADCGDNYRRRCRDQQQNNRQQPEADTSPPPPPAFGFSHGGANGQCPGAADPNNARPLTVLDNCFVSLRVNPGPCTNDAIQALHEGLGQAFQTGEQAVRGVVQGTVGLASDVMRGLEGLVDDAATAAASLSLDALVDVWGVGGLAGAWFDGVEVEE